VEKQKCKKCPGQQQANLEENLMAMAYLDFVGLNMPKKEASNFPDPPFEGDDEPDDGSGSGPDKREPDEGRDRPYDRQDPWQFKREVSPTHMNF
jgi:hypothetical protein